MTISGSVPEASVEGEVLQFCLGGSSSPSDHTRRLAGPGPPSPRLQASILQQNWSSSMFVFFFFLHCTSFTNPSGLMLEADDDFPWPTYLNISEIKIETTISQSQAFPIICHYPGWEINNRDVPTSCFLFRDWVYDWCLFGKDYL